MTFTDRAKDAARDDDTRRALDNALRQLEKAKASREELVDAVYRAARDAAETIRIRPVKPPKAPTGKGSPEAAILLLADWQMGKVTPSYNSDVAAERVRRCFDLAARLIVENRAPVIEAHVNLLGDHVEGEAIFPGQAHRIDASLYRQVFAVAQLIADGVRTLAATVPVVCVKGVIGNHGAMGGPIRREYHPETNLDAMAYNIARMLVGEDPRIRWEETFVANERAWYTTDVVMGRQWFLFHGDQVKSASLGVPWYGFGKRLLGWATSVADFEYAASGHWHQAIRWQVNRITHWGAGSTETSNTFAQEYLASGGQSPSQWLLFQGHRGMASEHLLRLDEVPA
jgi:hypothetical protein